MIQNPLAKYPRETLTGVPREAAAKLLASPKLKLSSKNRRGLKRALGERVVTPSCPPKSDLDRTFERLAKRPLESLLKRQKRLGRIIQNGRRLVADLAEDSMARRLVVADLDRWEKLLEILTSLVNKRVSGPAKRSCVSHKKRRVA